MFTQIETELDLLIATIEKKIDYIASLRMDAINPNIYAEHGGRLIGLTEAIDEIKNTRAIISSHIVDVLKNTTDGNYISKLDVLEDENRVLRDKIYLLQQDIEKIKEIKAKNLSNTPVNCLRELREDEINQKIEDKYNEDMEDEYFIEEDNEE